MWEFAGALVGATIIAPLAHLVFDPDFINFATHFKEINKNRSTFCSTSPLQQPKAPYKPY